MSQPVGRPALSPRPGCDHNYPVRLQFVVSLMMLALCPNQPQMTTRAAMIAMAANVNHAGDNVLCHKQSRRLPVASAGTVQ
jgi:hypothetical protein